MAIHTYQHLDEMVNDLAEIFPVCVSLVDQSMVEDSFDWCLENFGDCAPLRRYSVRYQYAFDDSKLWFSDWTDYYFKDDLNAALFVLAFACKPGAQMLYKNYCTKKGKQQ